MIFHLIIIVLHHTVSCISFNHDHVIQQYKYPKNKRYENNHKVSLSHCHNAGDFPPVQSLTINEDKKTDNLLIYPNPADNYIIIELSDELLNGSIVLYNHLGVVEYRGEINSHSIRIETDRLNNGIHFIKIVSDNQIIKLQKIIVNK